MTAVVWLLMYSAPAICSTRYGSTILGEHCCCFATTCTLIVVTLARSNISLDVQDQRRRGRVIQEYCIPNQLENVALQEDDARARDWLALALCACYSSRLILEAENNYVQSKAQRRQRQQIANYRTREFFGEARRCPQRICGGAVEDDCANSCSRCPRRLRERTTQLIPVLT